MDTQSLFGLEGLVAVITGGGRGLGLQMALALAANGAKAVYIVGRHLSVLQSAAASCPQGVLHPIVCDITSKPSLAAVASTIEREIGYVNLVIANAGAYVQPNFAIPRKDKGATIKDLKDFLWDQNAEGYAFQWEMNVTATVWTAVAFLELLDRGNKMGFGNKKAIANGEKNETALGESKDIPGETSSTMRPDQSFFTKATSAVTSQILVISSVSGLNKNGAVGFGYSASKAAQLHLSRQLAVQLEPFGIRSNVLAPGTYPTELSQPVILANFGSSFPRTLSPMERAGRAEEIAGTVVWLTGRAGAYCNGSIVLLDGGRLLVNPSVM